MLHLLSSLSVIFLKDLFHFVLFLLYAEVLNPEYMNRVLVHVHVHARLLEPSAGVFYLPSHT